MFEGDKRYRGRRGLILLLTAVAGSASGFSSAIFAESTGQTAIAVQARFSRDGGSVYITQGPAYNISGSDHLVADTRVGREGAGFTGYTPDSILLRIDFGNRSRGLETFGENFAGGNVDGIKRDAFLQDPDQLVIDAGAIPDHPAMVDADTASQLCTQDQSREITVQFEGGALSALDVGSSVTITFSAPTVKSPAPLTLPFDADEWMSDITPDAGLHVLEDGFDTGCEPIPQNNLRGLLSHDQIRTANAPLGLDSKPRCGRPLEF